MTEIDGKKFYTWDEIRAMPLGVKVKLSYWVENSFIFFRRQEYGEIVMVDEDQEIMNISEFDEDLLYQDRFELVEDKLEREYVTGCQALEKLINGEWEKITSAEYKNWMMKDFIKLSYCGEYFVNKNEDPILNVEVFEARFLKLKTWYEYKEQQ